MVDPGILVIVAIILLITLQPDPYKRILIFVKDGINITMSVTLISFFLVLILGLIGGLGRLAKNPIISGIASVYVEVVRGVPLLVQLLFWYFAFPSVVQQLGVMLQYRGIKELPGKSCWYGHHRD